MHHSTSVVGKTAQNKFLIQQKFLMKILGRVERVEDRGGGSSSELFYFSCDTKNSLRISNNSCRFLTFFDVRSLDSQQKLKIFIVENHIFRKSENGPIVQSTCQNYLFNQKSETAVLKICTTYPSSRPIFDVNLKFFWYQKN